MNVNGVEGLGALTNQKRGEDDADGGDGEDNDFNDDIYIMMKCLSVCL